MSLGIPEEELSTALEALTPRMKRVLVMAMADARRRGMSWIGTEHVLLALIEEPNGIAGRLLRQAAVDAALKDQIEEIFNSPGYWKTSRELRPAPSEPEPNDM